MKIVAPIFVYGEWKTSYEEQRFEQEAQALGLNFEACIVKEGENPDFSGIDALLPRVQLLDHLEERLLSLKNHRGILLNSYDSILAAKSKALSFEAFKKAALSQPGTCILTQASELSEAAQRLGGYPLILKNPHGSYGHGVMLAESERSARSIVDQLFKPWGDCEEVLLQEFIAEASGVDDRLFVCDGKVHAAIRRQAQGDEFRSNVALGGYAEAVQPSSKQVDLALKAVEVLGLDYAGVDLIESAHGPLLLEVNANPGFKALENATGVNIAGLLLQTLVKKACNPNKIL